MKKVTLACSLLAVALSAQAQVTLYAQDFSNGMPANYQLWNLDSLTPDDPALATMADSAWTVRNITAQGFTGGQAAFSVSWYVGDAGPSDDWMVLPGINVGSNVTMLKWDAMAITSSGTYRDRYQVFISNDSTYNGFSLTAPYFDTQDSGEVVTPTTRMLDLTALGFANERIYIAFRNWTKPYNPPVSVGGNELCIDNIAVTQFMNTQEWGESTFAIKAFPNPAQGSTSISFELQDADDIQVFVYNLRGQVVAHQPARLFQAGAHVLPVNLDGLAPGSYLLSLEGVNGKAVTRILVQ
jgi:hypothetical protein